MSDHDHDNDGWPDFTRPDMGQEPPAGPGYDPDTGAAAAVALICAALTVAALIGFVIGRAW